MNLLQQECITFASVRYYYFVVVEFLLRPVECHVAALLNCSVCYRMPAGYPVVRRKCSGLKLRKRSTGSFGRRPGVVTRKVS